MNEQHIYIALTQNETTESFMKPHVRAHIERLGNVLWEEDIQSMVAEDAKAALARTTAMITGWGQGYMSDEKLELFPNLKIIAHVAGSVGSIAGEEVYRRGIRVVSGNNIFAMSVAEAVLSYILALYRRIPYYDNLMKDGGWRVALDNEGLFNRRIALVGFGAIPRYLIPMLAPFNCTIQAYDPFVEEAEMAELGVQKIGFSECFTDQDIVSVHLPLNKETMEIIDDKHLRMMEPGSMLINTARGGVIDEDALAEVLAEKRIRAVLDVFTQEPLQVDSPLRSLDNVILIPHMAGPTLDRRAAAALAVAEDIERLFNGEELLHEINATRASRMTQAVKKGS